MTRSRASARQAGSRFERVIADWLKTRLSNDAIDRRVRNGQKDRGDIGGVKTALGGRVVIEAKDAARHDLSGWLTEAQTEAGNDDAIVGAVVFKRRGTANPAHQYVLMDLETFARLLEGGPADVCDCPVDHSADQWGDD